MRQFVSGLAVILAACSGGSATNLKSEGGTTRFVGVEAIAFLTDVFVLSSEGTGGPATSLAIEISDSPGLCARVGSRVTAPLESTLSLSIIRGTLPFTGQYAVGRVIPGDPVGFVTAALDELDGACATQTARSAVGGTLTVNQMDHAAAEGSVDVELDDGTRVLGDFSAAICGADRGGFSPSPDGGFVQVPVFRCGD